MKVTVVGAGNVGATCAQRIAENSIADVYLVDVLEGLAAGKALDLAEAAPIVGHGRRITGGTEYGPAEGSDLVVITAGIARKPGMSRDDLLATNGRIISEVVTNVMAHAPEAILLMVSNPLDVTTYIAQQVSGHPRERVFGMAGVLDTARFRTFIAMELDCSPEDVTAMVLGGHGDSMVPLPRHSTVSGIPVTELIPEDRLASIVQRTRDGGAEIVGLLKTGSAFYAPGAAVTQMVASILRDEKRILPTCVQLTGEYGLDDVFVGVPAKLGKNGIEQIIELDLNDEEADALRKSADAVRETVNAWKAMG
ncbi:MAG: malate dehydrogenase [Armatimonadetes bacterium]|nr:malate dehydrogenase [Armatimonadota bacterium]MDI9585127.1 malate dehydrogenase [Acidobacteriota bacterium]